MATLYDGLDWGEFILKAQLHGVTLQNVEIVTLHSYYETKCSELAMDLTEYNPDLDEDEWFKEVSKKKITIMDSGQVKVQESIIINQDYTATIILDDYTITDDSIDRGLLLLEKSTNIPGENYFGQAVTFSSEQVALHKEEIKSLREDSHVEIGSGAFYGS